MRNAALGISMERAQRIERDIFIRENIRFLREDGGLEIKKIYPNASTGHYAWVVEHMHTFLRRNRDVIRTVNGSDDLRVAKKSTAKSETMQRKHTTKRLLCKNTPDKKSKPARKQFLAAKNLIQKMREFSVELKAYNYHPKLSSAGGKFGEFGRQSTPVVIESMEGKCVIHMTLDGHNEDKDPEAYIEISQENALGLACSLLLCASFAQSVDEERQSYKQNCPDSSFDASDQLPGTANFPKAIENAEKWTRAFHAYLAAIDASA